MQHLAEDQGGPLARRQVLERGDESEPDRLALDRPLGRIGHRLDPGHLGRRVQVLEHRLLRRAEVHRARPPLPRLQHVEADVRRDAVEPGANRRAALEPVEAPPGADERLLHGILGVERRAEHAVAVAGELAAVPLELAEGGYGRRRFHRHGSYVPSDGHGHACLDDRAPGNSSVRDGKRDGKERSDGQGLREYLGLTRRLRRRPGAEPAPPSRHRRNAAARMGVPPGRLAGPARPRGRRERRGVADPRRGPGRDGRGRHGPQDVQRRCGPVGGRREPRGLVGRRPALPRSGLRRHPPPPRPHREAGRDVLHLRHRRDRGGGR